MEILSNIDTPTIVIELADSTRAGVFKPVYDDKQSSATLMLLMPMMIMMAIVIAIVIAPAIIDFKI